MARLNVNPTRMELGHLRNKLRVAIRGHKLLKDKSDEMIRQFLVLNKQNRQLRTRVESQLMGALGQFISAQAAMTSQAVASAIKTDFRPDITASTTSIMGLALPKLEYKETQIAPLEHPNANLQKSISALHKILPDIVSLGTIEKTCCLLAADIEKNRRRINALEHIMIPDTRETIKYIKMKLGENERQNVARLMRLGLKE